MNIEIPAELKNPSQLTQVWAFIKYQEQLLNKHTHEKHQDEIVATCHDCGHFAQEIRTAKDAINFLNQLAREVGEVV